MKLVVIAWVLTPSHPPPSVRAELVEAGARSLILLHACAKGGCRDVRPAAHLLFLRRQEKKAKEGDPQSATPALRYGANLRRCACGVRRGTRFAAAQRRSDSHGESDHEAWALRRPCHPATAPPQVCPVAQRRGRRLGIAFSLVTFFWRSKRKLLRRRAHSPAPATCKGMKQKRPLALINKAQQATKTGAPITQPPCAPATSQPTPQTSNKSPAS